MIKNFAQLRHLIALSETGSFTQAARAVNRSQPAFSRSIAELESDVGAPLVDRVGHSNELTFIGRAVVEHARQVVFEADELARCVSDHLGGRAGHFRFGLGSTPSALLMGPLLTYAAISQPAPKITLSRGPIEQQVTALRERRLDALVVDMRAVNPTRDLTIERIASLKTGILTRPNHPLQVRSQKACFADLRRYPVASTSISDEVIRLLVSTFGPEGHPSELVTLCCEDINSLLAACCDSDALFMGVIATGRHHIENGTLVELPFDTRGLDAHFALVRLARQVVPPAFAPVRQLIMDFLHDLLPGVAETMQSPEVGAASRKNSHVPP
ncbi:MAG: LysR family transcriptional regulator [Casimicrobium sp.]